MVYLALMLEKEQAKGQGAGEGEWTRADSSETAGFPLAGKCGRLVQGSTHAGASGCVCIFLKDISR